MFYVAASKLPAAAFHNSVDVSSTYPEPIQYLSRFFPDI